MASIARESVRPGGSRLGWIRPTRRSAEVQLRGVIAGQQTRMRVQPVPAARVVPARKRLAAPRPPQRGRVVLRPRGRADHLGRRPTSMSHQPGRWSSGRATSRTPSSYDTSITTAARTAPTQSQGPHAEWGADLLVAPAACGSIASSGGRRSGRGDARRLEGQVGDRGQPRSGASRERLRSSRTLCVRLGVSFG
jgi:hypothetical protein